MKLLKHILLCVVAALPCAAGAQTYLDVISFGDASSESAHSFSNSFTITYTNTSISPAQVARRCQSISQTNIYGGTLTFNLAVDPKWRNYFSVKFWGDDDNSSVLGQASDMGRLYPYVPVSNYVASATNNYQVGYRHEGD